MITEYIPIGSIVMANDGNFYEKVSSGFRFLQQPGTRPWIVPNRWIEQIGILEIPDQE